MAQNGVPLESLRGNRRSSPGRITRLSESVTTHSVVANLTSGGVVELHDCWEENLADGISAHATGRVFNPIRLQFEVWEADVENMLIAVFTQIGVRALVKPSLGAALVAAGLRGFTLDPVRFTTGYRVPVEFLEAYEGSRFLQVWGRSCNVPWQVFGGPNACLSGCGHVIICPHCGAYFPTCPWCRRATTRYLFPSRSNDPDLPLMLMDGERGPCVDGARWDGSDIFHLGAARIGITQRFLNVLLEMQATSFHADPIGVLTEGMSDEQREWLVRAKGTA